MKTFSVTKNGKPLAKKLYSWNKKTRTFSSTENELTLDFSGIDYVTFKTGSNCTFDASCDCTFDTGCGCTFTTGNSCTFATDRDCTFKTGNNCTFDTDRDCTFKTGGNCTFKTDWNCTFDIGWGCTFKTGSYCTFDTSYGCTFKTGIECVIVRRDIFEIIQPLPEVTIKLNAVGVLGFKEIKSHTVVIDGEEISISDESFNSLKKSLTNGS